MCDGVVTSFAVFFVLITTLVMLRVYEGFDEFSIPFR